jgi:hypothetical protein
MRLQPITQPGYTTDVEFLASRKNIVTKPVTLDADMFRTGQYTANKKIANSATPLGKVTASGLYGPVKKTTVKTTAAIGATNVELTDARFFQVGDSVVIGTEASKAISAINYDTNTITVTALAAEQAAGVTVKANNGLETAECILFNTVDLTDGDAAVAAVTQAVVREARIPAVNSLIKADLARVEFR